MMIVGVIPSHLNSKRFKKKILYKIKGLPMIEHVRRRAMLCKELKKKIIVCSCNKIIEKTIKKFNGSIIMTSNRHKNGTSRVIEALNKIKATHIIIIQGDEPLLDPTYLTKLVKIMYQDKNNKKIHAWNLISRITEEKHISDKTFVKCFLNNDLITNLFRYEKSFKKTKKIYKILGLIAFKKRTLLKLKKLKPSKKENQILIEQLRIIENGMNLRGVKVKVPLPSVNQPRDIKIVENFLNVNKKQKELLSKISKF
ncbi:MAG: 3-deoxy-manno-octulosonate cytidylyltransferase [Candidatus Pelagibacter sp.]|nr:3-deoxy-manno-octulosonate cytidylyltransferase [Candidatus Pelagibacter sp.]|tara:strand:+ start:1386 stop:2150 length:765 start_codon:yes stop_codon:yes gene_type:complete